MADEKDVNDEIFWNYFTYQNPSLLTKYLIRATELKMRNKQANLIMDWLI